MATITTFTRPRPADASVSVASSDLTPSALGALGTIIVTEDASALGGATVRVILDAYSWTGVQGVPLDPRTQRPFRVAPWVPSSYPSTLSAIFSALPLSAYLTTTATAYAGLLASLSSGLGEWGWTSTTEQS